MSEFEYSRIVEELRSLDPATARRVLEQTKERIWFEDTTYTACLFLDVTSQLCLIYSARPLVCRLFGRAIHLPCPLGKLPADLDPSRAISAYASQPLHTFEEWLMINDIFNFEALLGAGTEPAPYEL